METTIWNSERERARGKSHRSDDRGRNAESPQNIPSKGWKDTLIRVKNETAEDRVSLISAAMAFYALMALVPALSSVVLIYAWISDPADITQQLSQLAHIMPSQVSEIVESQLSSLAGQANSTLGLGAITSLGLTLWSASRANVTAMEAFNIIYEEREERGFIKRNAIAIGLALLGVVLALVAIGVIVGIPTVTAFMNLEGIMQLGITAAGWLILITLFAFYLATNYRFGPNRKQPKWKWVSPGAMIAAVMWVVASGLFSFYVSAFGNYNETYGSLGGMIVLMFWFYISSFVILLGGQINAELEHQTTRDTTKEPGKPMGSRGAHMADTVGESKDSWKA